MTYMAHTFKHETGKIMSKRAIAERKRKNRQFRREAKKITSRALLEYEQEAHEDALYLLDLDLEDEQEDYYSEYDFEVWLADKEREELEAEEEFYSDPFYYDDYLDSFYENARFISCPHCGGVISS